MKYELVDDQRRQLTLDKDELITLLSVAHEGLEFLRIKKQEGNDLASLKYAGARIFVDELNSKIMAS